MSIALDFLDAVEDIEEEYTVLDLTDLDLDQDLELDEAVGTLKGLSRYFMKAVTSRGGGEHSDVMSSGKIPNASAFSSHLGKAMKSGTAVVYKNGKPIAAVHPGAYDPGKYNVHTSSEQTSQQKTRYQRGGKYSAGRDVKYNDSNYNKGDATSAVRSIVHGPGEDNYKDHHIEIKTYQTDKEREAKAKTRRETRPDMQINYAKGMSKTKYSDRSDSKQVSRTPAGSMDKIKNVAALKLAKQKLGDKGSPLQKAKELHTEIGKHIEAGNHDQVRKSLDALDTHMRQIGLEKENPNVRRYADALKNNYSWDKKTRSELRGESKSTASMVMEELNEIIPNSVEDKKE